MTIEELASAFELDDLTCSTHAIDLGAVRVGQTVQKAGGEGEASITVTRVTSKVIHCSDGARYSCLDGRRLPRDKSGKWGVWIRMTPADTAAQRNRIDQRAADLRMLRDIDGHLAASWHDTPGFPWSDTEIAFVAAVARFVQGRADARRLKILLALKKPKA